MKTQTTAQLVANACRNSSAATLAGGYAMNADGSRVTFEPARITGERRNPNGRVTSLRASYADGSALAFRWNESNGATFTVAAP